MSNGSMSTQTETPGSLDGCWLPFGRAIIEGNDRETSGNLPSDSTHLIGTT
jgi:hypothetical protein